MRYLSFAAIITLFLSCQSTPSQPASPEEVVRQYQAYFDKNEFAEARALSTPDGIQLLEGLEMIFADAPTDSILINTTFLSIDCRENVDTAWCLCRLKDEYETYTSEYKLLRMDGKWLVDVPEEEEEIGNFEELFPEMDEADTLQ